MWVLHSIRLQNKPWSNQAPSKTLPSFWILINPVIELFSSLANKKYKRFSKGVILKQVNVVILDEHTNLNLRVSSFQFLQKNHCVAYQVVHPYWIFISSNTSLYESSYGSTNIVSWRTFSSFSNSTFNFCWNLKSWNSLVISNNWFLIQNLVNWSCSSNYIEFRVLIL